MQPHRAEKSASPLPSSQTSEKNRLDRVRRQTLVELSSLAQDVAASLRRHATPTVRVSAALLLTASLAACAPAAGDFLRQRLGRTTRAEIGLG